MAWKAMDPLTALTDDSSSDPDDEDEEKSNAGGAAVSRTKGAEKGGGDAKKVKLDFDALTRYGYSGGPSILHVPAPKQEVGDKTWSWSNGKLEREAQHKEESIEERDLTREIANERTAKCCVRRQNCHCGCPDGCPDKLYIFPPRQLLICSDLSSDDPCNALPLQVEMVTEALTESAFVKQQKREAIAEQKALSFSQKEKRKRDLGQASRGKNYVEEEKRLLRDSGVYSGFDT